ncbi:MFS transporter [Halobacteriovorax marinus]|uniref:MFS transporter n=1 Tax=Halobacteriovorax marinus TaxID=97084 RepID=A0A1Y5F4F1_9BACT|nr:MFS transporter [Halobacteriovorax marinus]
MFKQTFNIFNNTSSQTKLLLLMASFSTISFATWNCLLNNYAVETLNFTGVEIGILHSIREIPGLLAFSVVFVLMFIKEQKLAYLSILLLGFGIAFTGFFKGHMGFYITTVIMSVGFHYLETIQSSLTLQWVDKKDTPVILGKVMAMRSASSLVTYALVWIFLELMNMPYEIIYALGGVASILSVIIIRIKFPIFNSINIQKSGIILRKKYWLYYALTFMSGARRQIFMVFAGFMMVQKFGFSASSITLIYILNHILNFFIAPRIGQFIGRVGEKRALTIEYIGLIFVFTAYAFVSDRYVAAGLYIVDHLFFSMGISIKTYFQKIANAEDIAGSSAVSFTINHIAAVIIPALFGLIWSTSPEFVFLAGSGMALISLFLSQMVPGVTNTNFDSQLSES